MKEPDGQLVGWSQIHDPAAFAELVWRHGAAVHAYLARRTRRQEADDLLSEVWLKAFSGRAAYDSSWPDARPWLYGIARNVLLNHLRREDRPLSLPAASSVDPWPEVDSRIDASSQWSAMCSALRTLSEDDREVLLLVAWEGLTPAEVALALGVPQGTVRSRLHRARHALADRLEIDPRSPLIPTDTEV
ncbi:MAG: RNA polymerase sigma factor [Acidimicrobiales bacterium]